MNQSAVKKIFLFLGILFLWNTMHVQAQDVDNNHFIYIQAKAKEPFYVILNKNVYSSSSIGYLIIPKLKDGSYDLRIGFPKEQAPEQNFTCVVKGGDAGYSLEKGDNGQLGLLNLQSKQFIASSSQTTLEDQYASAPSKSASSTTGVAAESKKDTNAVVSDNSAFSDMLSNVANDPTLGKPVVQPKAILPKTEDKLSTQVSDFGSNPEADSKAIAAASTENLQPAEDISSDMSKTYGVIKSGQGRSKAGTEMTFIMFNSRSTDTVKILVPQDKEAANEDETTGVAPEHISKKESLALFTNTEADSFNVEPPTGANDRRKARQQKREAKKFVNIDGTENSATTANAGTGNIDNPFYDKSKDDKGVQDIQSSSDEKQNPEQSQVKDKKMTDAAGEQTAPTCDNPISDKDFNKMQKKMIARNNDNDMIAIVDKYIKGKCLTTSQVKQLGGLFLSDAGRYALYHDAYSSVSDKQNFPGLEDQLLDSYFKKRFQQIVK